MYETLALIALFVLVYSSVAGAVEHTWISGSIVFTCFGLLVGPIGLDLLSWETDAETSVASPKSHWRWCCLPMRPART